MKVNSLVVVATALATGAMGGCSSSASPDGSGDSGRISSGSSSSSSGSASTSSSGTSSSSGSSGGSSSTSSGSSSSGGSGPADDGGAPDSGGGDDAGMTSDAAGEGDGAMVGMGQYSATLNATTPYHLGGEHLGYTVYGTVVDTTAGANRARVGWIQKTLVTAGYHVKWVWSKILVAGHTYELAMFEDHLKDRTCEPMDRTWILKIPAPTADFVFNWIQPVPYTTGTCTDFPVGPIP